MATASFPFPEATNHALREEPQTFLLADPLLHSWLHTEDPQIAQSLLTTIITEHGEPIIRNIVSYKLSPDRSGRQGQGEVVDVCQEVVLQLLSALQQYKHTPQRQPIQSLRNYVAVMTHHLCAAYLRRQAPQRQRLKDQLRYLLTRHPAFALWENSQAGWSCGLAQWQAQSIDIMPAAQAMQLSGDVFAQQGNAANLVSVLTMLFQHLPGPIELETLVKIVAQQMNIKDQPTQVWSEVEEKKHLLVPFPSLGTTATEQRYYLQQIWREIGTLPLPNRLALLLNLRDGKEKGLLTLFADLQIASLPEIAQILALSPMHFAQLWQSLPLEDTQIADLLGVTRQQVINLRKAARRWLGRQLNAPPAAR